jgi:excisionase family DNA binding protein
LNVELLELYLSLDARSREVRFADTARAADLVGLSRRTIQLWIRKGEIRAVRVGHKKYQVCLSSLKACLHDHLTARSPAALLRAVRAQEGRGAIPIDE